MAAAALLKHCGLLDIARGFMSPAKAPAAKAPAKGTRPGHVDPRHVGDLSDLPKEAAEGGLRKKKDEKEEEEEEDGDEDEGEGGQGSPPRVLSGAWLLARKLRPWMKKDRERRMKAEEMAEQAEKAWRKAQA